MSNDAVSSGVGQRGWGEGPAPRFTLTVQIDGRPESDRLAQVVRRVASGGSGPDLINLVPHGVERWNQDAALGCRGTLVALPGAVGCVIGQTLVTLPMRGEIARLHGQIAQAEGASGARGVGDAPREAMAEIMEGTVDAPQWSRAGGEASGEASGAAGASGRFRGGAVEAVVEAAASEASLLELRSRVARLEGALVGQLTARLDSRLSQVATREEMQEVADEVTTVMAAVTAMKALIEQQQLHEQQRQDGQGAWREEQRAWQEAMIQEMRSYSRQVEALSHDNEAMKAQLGQRWWQRWKM